MSMGTEIRHIPQDVLDTTRAQIVKKRKDARYSQTEWDYHRRMAERLYPEHAD
jgi:hypothetical protein